MPSSNRSCHTRNANRSQRAAASRAVLGSADIPQHECGHVIALYGAGGELANAGQDAIEEVGHALLAELAGALDQALFPVLFTREAERLCDPVAEGDEDIARRHADGFFLERGVLEQAENEAARLEALDA